MDEAAVSTAAVTPHGTQASPRQHHERHANSATPKSQAAAAHGRSSSGSRAKPLTRSTTPRAKRDPGAALVRAEQMAARKAALDRLTTEPAEVSPRPKSARGVNTSRTSMTSGCRSARSSTTSGFGTSSSASGFSRSARFASGPTERGQTSSTVGPGSYNQSTCTIASGASDCGQHRGATRFTYGTAPIDMQVDVSAAQMAYEAKGLEFMNRIHSEDSDGWLRSDYNRFMLAADHRAHYVQQKKLQDMARQQMQADEQHYRDRGHANWAETNENRKMLAEQKEELKRAKSEEFLTMKAERAERAELLSRKAKAYTEHAKQCVTEARGLSMRSRHARHEVEGLRARKAEAMRQAQHQAAAAAREEQERRDQERRTLLDKARSNRVPSPTNMDESGANHSQGSSFLALTKEEKAAADEAMAEAKVAREKAKERARALRKKESERAAEASKGVRQTKNLSQLVREEAIKKREDAKEKARREAEERALMEAVVAAAEARVVATILTGVVEEAEVLEQAAQIAREEEEARKAKERKAAAKERKERARLEAAAAVKKLSSQAKGE